jgi:hypothetical protein
VRRCTIVAEKTLEECGLKVEEVSVAPLP